MFKNTQKHTSTNIQTFTVIQKSLPHPAVCLAVEGVNHQRSLAILNGLAVFADFTVRCSPGLEIFGYFIIRQLHHQMKTINMLPLLK